MTMAGLHSNDAVLAALLAGWLMVVAAVAKRQLRWRDPEQTQRPLWRRWRRRDK